VVAEELSVEKDVAEKLVVEKGCRVRLVRWSEVK
jgi:hypothetical protein